MFWHGGDQFVQHAALTEQGMGARPARIRLQKPVHSQPLPDLAQLRQQRHGEGADQQQPVTAHGITDAGCRYARVAHQPIDLLDGVLCCATRLTMWRGDGSILVRQCPVRSGAFLDEAIRSPS